MRFRDRVDAGRCLARRLGHVKSQHPIVLGLPRGGVPVALEVAAALDAPLDVIVVRKLGVPYQPELGFGAIGEDGVTVINDDIVDAAGVSGDDISAVERRERAELERRVHVLRGGAPRLDLRGRVAIIVDDGIATGSTARAACRVARAHGASRVVLAVPVAPTGWTPLPEDRVDEFIVVEQPADFGAVGQFYRDFAPTTDDDVVACLDRGRVVTGPRDADVVVVAGGGLMLEGHLTVPSGARGIVVFAHGSGSSRRSPRNRFVATVLQDAGLGTLLFDLLSEHEAEQRENVFDVQLLGQRLRDATTWLRSQPGLGSVAVGYFGASTGAAAALWAAAEPGADVGAIVSRGGRPDLAGSRLGVVRAPTLLIVGADDSVVLDLNRRAQTQMRCENHLAVIPGATHLFEEAGTLEAAAQAACDWFVRHFAAVPLAR